MEQEWLIDGYNLLHALNAQSFEVQKFRNAVFSAIADFAALEKVKILIVLDGIGPDQELLVYQTAYLEVMYSQKISADTFIEKRLFERRSFAALTVVTNDRAVSAMACGGGARVLKVNEFSKVLKLTQKESKDILFDEKVRSHGFNRPFEKKLKDFNPGPKNEKK